MDASRPLRKRSQVHRKHGGQGRRIHCRPEALRTDPRPVRLWTAAFFNAYGVRTYTNPVAEPESPGELKVVLDIWCSAATLEMSERMLGVELTSLPSAVHPKRRRLAEAVLARKIDEIRRMANLSGR
jgi:hypothetical protein